MDNNQNPNNGFNNVNPTNNLNNNGNINNQNYNGMYNPLNQPTQPQNNVPNQGAGEQVINQTQNAYQQPVMSQPQDNYQQPMMSQPQNNYQQPIINQPQDNFQQPMDSPTNDFNGSDVKKPKIKLVLIIVLAAAVIGVGAFLLLRKDSEKNDGIDITDSTSFFIEDKNEKNALFNEDGKQLTDFIFSYASYFRNGTAIVEQNDAYGIINENGKMTVDFGKYEYIYPKGGMYYVRTEDNQEFLINGSDKVLYELNDNITLHTYTAVDSYLLLEDAENKIYKILDYKGKTLISFPMNSNEKEEPSLNHKNEYISVFYNNKNYIINFATGKKIMSYDANMHFCLNNVVDNGKIITMNSCSSKDDDEETYYKFIKNGKLYDLTSKCEEVYYSDNNLKCIKESTTYLLDNNLNVGINLSINAYIDNNTYASDKDNYNGVDFYNNGKFVKNVECRRLKEHGYAKNGLYVLRTYDKNSCNIESSIYEYYKTNGEKAFDKTFKYASGFDENGLAEVSEDNENYYLIDSNGKKISQDYSKISSYSEYDPDYYIVTKNKKDGIIDKNGNVIVECEYKYAKSYDSYAILPTLDSKYITYDLKNKSVIISSDERPVLQNHYISVFNNEIKQYYTYKGKLFYEEK